jgi:probable F420-dependent oxidoreductase
MKFWLSLVSNMEYDQLLDLARFAEEVGFHGVTMADHLVMPAHFDSKYPYTEDGKIWWPEDTPWLDPWLAISAMGAVTSRLQFVTNIYLAALRDPFTAAKLISSASALTNERVTCGVSVGWIKEEYDLLGIDFASRGRRLDEMVDVMHKLWTGKVVSHCGEFFNFADALMCPAPRKPIKVWSGGGSKPALRRAALNDGWLGLPMTVPQLKTVVDNMHAIRREAGLSIDTFDVCASLVEPLTQSVVDALQTMKVNNVVFISPWLMSPWDDQRWIDDGDDLRKLDVKKKALERFADVVIRKSSKN